MPNDEPISTERNVSSHAHRPAPVPPEWLVAFLNAERLPAGYADDVRRFYIPLAEQLASLHAARKAPLIIGINGAQGTGKSTLAKVLKTVLEHSGHLKTTILSLDDLYFSQAVRNDLALTVHPLLKTRGVPGTHDAIGGLKLLRQLRSGRATTLPRFDKSIDTPTPPEAWETILEPVDVVLFEGWCIHAIAQPEQDLEAPINRLEQECDGEGQWRRYVNDQLKTAYAALFSELDFLVHLKAPDFASVVEWRRLQEKKLAEVSGAGAPGVMDDTALERFMMHYERLTRWMLEEMCGRADRTIRLRRDHTVERMEAR